MVDLRACVLLPGPLPPMAGPRYVIGVDLGLKSDRTAVAVCHADGHGSDTRVILDHLAVWQGTSARPVNLGEVENWLAETSRRYGYARVVADPWQSVGMNQRLRSAGVHVEEFKFSQESNGRLALTLHTAIRDHRLALPDDEELLDELANVRMREASPGVFRMDHDPDRHDDRATALALAAHDILSTPTGQGAIFMEWMRMRFGRNKITTDAEAAQEAEAVQRRHLEEKAAALHAEQMFRASCQHYWFDGHCVNCNTALAELAVSA